MPEPAVSSSNRPQALESPRRTPCSRAESSDPVTEQIEVFATARSNKNEAVYSAFFTALCGSGVT